MNQNEALKFLGISSIDECQDAIETRIFEIKQNIIANCHVPQLILAKKKKLKQILLISESLNYEMDEFWNNFEIENCETDSILDSFNVYHKNRALILKKIVSSNNLNFLFYCSDLLQINLKNWCEKWPKLETDQSEEVKLSRELDSVEMFRLLKELSGNNELIFSTLKSDNLPMSLLMEIQRLNLIAKFYC
jgi:hypothetical protein